ncbi:MAG: hypothetical protein GY768_15940 [Planctomycetaceae bacterium]|nr:hypothetical protein [Planctomycetaceae bacterium]
MTDKHPPLPPSVASLLGRLRRRIRWYVWLEGITLAIVWLSLTFWIGLAIDYLPVLAGASEMPRPARLVLLLLISTGLAYILYRWILRRAFVRFANRSLAILLERQHPELHDALMTTVELSEQPTGDGLHQSMLGSTVAETLERTENMHLGQVFNRAPLMRNFAAAVIATISIALFAVLANQAFATWTSRLLLISDQAWPRRAHIEVLDFSDQPRKVAEGSDLTVRVRADATRSTPPPELCVIYYQLASGESGRVNMSRDGETQAGYQYYRFDGKPFQGMLDDVTFDVVGFDARVRDRKVDVVKSPSVTRVDMDCVLPKYTGRLDRKQPWRPGTSLPAGSQVQLTISASKPLKQVAIDDLNAGTSELVDFSPGSETTQFDFKLPKLMQPTALQISLLDVDGISSQQPYRLAIATLEDLAPQVDVLLKGIGTAITPQARIPLVGEIVDDYGVNRSWFDISAKESKLDQQIDFAPTERGRVETVLDLREQATRDDDPWRLQTGTNVVLSIKADDFFDLAEAPNTGQGDEYALDVVTPDELLAILEARELNLKRRFEQVIAEMTTTRDRLLRLQAGLQPDATDESAEPGDQKISEEREWSLRVLQVQRANQQGDKSRQEVSGVAASFDGIREEIVNNRVDTEERKIRLQNQIITPLNLIADNQFPSWQEKLEKLQTRLEAKEPDLEGTREVVLQANRILLALEDILAKMLELETYNELVDLVRSIIREQEELSKQTKEERKKKARSLLED